MRLNFAVQMDPIERINIRGDSTFALLLEAQARAHPLSYYTPDRMALRDGKVSATVRPLVVRMGGTVPIAELFQRHMGLDTVFFSFSTADEDFHAPNEFFRLHRLHEGLEAWARYWRILGEATA